MRRPLQSPALINAFYDSLRPEQRETAMVMQRAILSVAPHLRPEVKWGNLCFMNEHDNVMAIALFRLNAHLQIFNGVVLVPEFPELQGVGKGMRHIKTRYRQPVNEQLVRELTLASLQASAAAAHRASHRWG
ncbi:MAG: DUF1801 domain-containing protein [Aquabacterium sp.]|jgi:uncharacterized protein YdhG (YjbR/CyaY superfamily)|uniref:DUF1801 domain-containing protein n=1 Tax=Aquabacterium sp. TaxID=1872578 RepID=UPI001B67EFC5|nr:DUF1801 domain-containing protein [Aquabacterium sp.]MBP7132369.1 DUF1801 domain-containing protein [Aquabacterium sp.]MBP9063339.1 DUF1801 domain-containing protein [Aquabacterium sp.]MDQ5926400.1 hypothetical protein [Pseudomonadota bacterium]